MNKTYFVNNFCRIPHAIHGLIRFDTYPFQDDLLRNFENHRYNIVLKARQMGISTLVSGYALWLMTFFPDKSVLCIAINQETAKNLSHFFH